VSASHYLAIDLGAESGRVILGSLSEDRLSLQEIHRFPNHVITAGDHLQWDLAQLEKEIVAGLEKAAQRGEPISGLSTDSWGVDYVLLDAQGRPTAPSYCYRDSRNQKGADWLLKKLPFPVIYGETGIQFMTFNTIYQFEAHQHQDAATLAKADHFLFIADYFNALFSGVAAVDESLASTAQLFDPRTKAWSKKLISELALKESFFPRLVPCGSVLGPVTGPLARHPAMAQAKVIATCSHDTGAAVAAVPARGDKKWAYLSSGTWSLLGAELPGPVITDAGREAGFTNEVGLGGTILYLKNIAGLWVVQECRRAWHEEGKTFDYEELTRLAVENGPAAAHLVLSDPRFITRGDMPKNIADFCRETGQPVPASPGAFVRTALESLALAYAPTLRQLETLIGHKIETLHIVGGGSRNDLLNQITADAAGVEVVTGPIEATAIGNILIQAFALGRIESLGHLRRIVEKSFPTRRFTPSPGLSGDLAAKLQKILSTQKS
jgi:rhamnulokinase